MKYLGNAFALGMLPLALGDETRLTVRRIDVLEFCKNVKEPNTTNTINHIGTVNVINLLCGTNFTVNRIEVKLKRGDKLYVITLLERLPEGKVLTTEEVVDLLQKDKVGFFEVKLE